MTRKLTSPDDFEALMREIDAAMQHANVAIPLREIAALREAAKLLGLELVGHPRKDPPTPGVYTAEDLPGHIFNWVRQRYGDRLKVDLSNGYSVVLIRGVPWLLRFPLIFGTVSLACDRDLSRTSSGIKRVDPKDPSTRPMLNVLTCIQDMPQGLASQLTVIELRNIMEFFLFGHESLNDLNIFCRGEPLVLSALTNLHESSHACLSEAMHGESRRASLQAAGKLLAFYIQKKGGVAAYTDELSVLAANATTLGLPTIDSQVLAALQYDLGVHSESEAHGIAEVVNANHAVLIVSASVVQSLYATKISSPRREPPRLHRPFVTHVVRTPLISEKSQPLETFKTYANPSSGRLLERLVAAMHVAETPDIEVRWNDKIDGRQFDVTLRFRKGVHDYLTVIECKDFAGTVPVEKVEAFVTKASDAGANKAVMISSAGFQSGCLRVAERHHVRLFTIEESFREPQPVSGESIDGISFVSLAFTLADAGAQVDVPSHSARFSYIWEQGRIKTNGIETSIGDLARIARPTDFTELPVGQEETTIDLDPDAVLSIPYEDPVRVSAMTYARVTQRFTKPVAPLPKGSLSALDPFLQERFQLTFRLRDERGNVVQEEQLRGLPFGFDTELREQTFYESPALGFHYYLKKMTPDVLTWIAIETYQHGRLIQVEYTQKPEHAKGMVVVTDTATLKRLRRILAGMEATPRGSAA